MSTTGADLMEFLDDLIATRVINPAYKSSTKRVLADVLGPGWAQQDAVHLDAEEVLRRFERAAGANLGPGSLESYKSRFRRSVALFQQATSPESRRTVPFSEVLREVATALDGLEYSAFLTQDEADDLRSRLYKQAREAARRARMRDTTRLVEP